MLQAASNSQYSKHNKSSNIIPQDIVQLICNFYPDDTLCYRLVCADWNAYILSFFNPQTAHQVLLKNKNAEDGEHTLYFRGMSSMPFNCEIFDIKSNDPRVYISLVHTEYSQNYSYFPYNSPGRIRTNFTKLRIDPKYLVVKTNDYTFSSSTGNPFTQKYWNGSASLHVTRVPYATARNCIDRAAGCGQGNIDLRGTPFNVQSKFVAMGCRPGGSAVYESNKQVVELVGFGYAGRVCAELDITLSEDAQPGDNDNEGENGGWVLVLNHILNKQENEVPEKYTAKVKQVNLKRGYKPHEKQGNFRVRYKNK